MYMAVHIYPVCNHETLHWNTRVLEYFVLIVNLERSLERNSKHCLEAFALKWYWSHSDYKQRKNQTKREGEEGGYDTFATISAPLCSCRSSIEFYVAPPPGTIPSSMAANVAFLHLQFWVSDLQASPQCVLLPKIIEK